MIPGPIRPPRIARAENDLLFDESGRRFIDLFTGHGAVWLGHGNPETTAAVVEQARKVWVTGGLETAAHDAARAMVEGFFPASHALAGFYSTGMEAAEFALRVARVATGRNGAVGFARSMHGKSLATAFLAWDNHDDLELPGFQRLPFLPECSEGEILIRLREALARRTTAAVFVEPIQGSGGGHAASPGFHRAVQRLCADAGALLVFDEILTGFYRTGSPFFFSDLGFTPDVILIGKALANGFPASGVVVNRDYPIQKKMLPGSTFAGNPLAAAAVRATLRQIRRLDLPGKAARIEQAVTEAFGPLHAAGLMVRGKGALWILEAPAGVDVGAAVASIHQRGVCVGHAGRLIRVLPAATIEPDNLRAACAVVREECLRAIHGRN